MIYITSDLHFGHNKPFLYQPRGFNSIEEHDNTIIQNWNNIVNDNDDVYVLGDLMLGDMEYGLNCLSQLKGKLHIIIGNHDTDNKIQHYYDLPNVVEIADVLIIKYNKYRFYLSHYPTITSNINDKHYFLINLYGHTHQQTNFYENNCFMYHVGLDSHNNTPVSIDHIIVDIKAKKETQAN